MSQLEERAKGPETFSQNVNPVKRISNASEFSAIAKLSCSA